jgi:hypothetical protein
MGGSGAFLRGDDRIVPALFGSETVGAISV